MARTIFYAWSQWVNKLCLKQNKMKFIFHNFKPPCNIHFVVSTVDNCNCLHKLWKSEKVMSWIDILASKDMENMATGSHMYFCMNLWVVYFHRVKRYIIIKSCCHFLLTTERLWLIQIWVLNGNHQAGLGWGCSSETMN